MAIEFGADLVLRAGANVVAGGALFGRIRALRDILRQSRPVDAAINAAAMISVLIMFPFRG